MPQTLRNVVLPERLQDLGSDAARLCIGVEKFCRVELGIPSGSSILLAVSGGADSVAMAVIFRILAARMDLNLHALHVNHNLREQAAQDAFFTRDLCDFLRIGCQIAMLDTRLIARERRCGIEEAARIGRYELLGKTRAELGADLVAVAHHAGDLCEDILLRLIRGAGWPALGGMKARDDARGLIRPLLRTQGRELRAFLTELAIPWREDESNASLDFRRNRIRHVLLPFLRGENPAIERGLGHLHALAEIDEEYWENALSRALAETPWRFERGDEPSLVLPGALLAGLEPAARLRLYHRAARFMRLNSGARLAGQTRADSLFRLDRAFLSGRREGRFQLSGGLEAILRGRDIVFMAR